MAGNNFHSAMWIVYNNSCKSDYSFVNSLEKILAACSFLHYSQSGSDRYYIFVDNDYYGYKYHS